ncbi:MAG: HAD family hydrolase [Candidatus Zixiibacteriota bacterium]|nr:MAG: HAD family hydrolase [candidate division Zixibacteria bacterium]
MKKLSNIEAISFDADGTLWDFEKVMRNALNFVLLELKKLDPVAATKIDIDQMITIREEVAEKLKGVETNLERLRLEAFCNSLAAVGRPDDTIAEQLNSVYLKHRFEDIELYPDILPTLEILKKRYTLGIVSNGNSFPGRCGLDGVFEFIVFSQDYGIEKPDPRLFEIAIEKAGCPREQMLHVGDSLECDILGSARAGIKSVWLNRNRINNDSSVRPDYEITFLNEILDIL